ncbi:MAG: nuclease A inhibitor family protein [bacterium]
MPRTHLCLSALAALLATSACTATSDIAAPTAPAAVATNLLPIALPAIGIVPGTERLLLEAVSNGLLYTSESDYPFVYFRHAGLHNPAQPALSAAAFGSLVGIAPNTPIEVISLDAFFARHIERVDPSDAAGRALIPRFILLRETLRRSLSHTRVYRVGTIAIDCYIVGFDVNGDLQGLTTIAIET